MASGLLLTPNAAQAQLRAEFSGTPGAGTLTVTLSGSDIIPVTAPTPNGNVRSVSFNTTGNFLTGGINVQPTALTGTCQSTSPSGPIAISNVSSLRDVGGLDVFHIEITSNLLWSVGQTISCSGTLTFPTDINNLTVPAGQTLTVTDTSSSGVRIVIVNTLAPTTPVDKPNTIAALQSTFNSATPGLLDSFESFRTLAPNGNGITFAPTGLGFVQSGIDSANPMDRDYGALFSPRGYFDGGQKLRSGNGFKFSVDLNQLARGAANENEASLAAYGAVGSKDRATRPQSRVTSFIKGEYVDFDDDETNADRDGHLWVMTSGVGLRLSSTTTVGVLTRYREGKADSNALTAELDSDFWGGGAYLTTTLGGLNVAVAGLYESGDNDIRIGTTTGSFDSDHVTIEGHINKRLERGTYWIEPGVSLRYLDTDQDNYTDSAGTFVINQDLKLGRLTYGPKIGTTIHKRNATLKPYVKLNGVWDFENDGNFATPTAGIYTSADTGLNLGGGVEMAYLSGLSIRLQGDWFTYDNDLDVWSVSGGIGTPLSVLGLGQVGFLSLDLAAKAEDASAQARLRMPLGKVD